MRNLSRLADTEWADVEPPRLHDKPQPQRAVTGFTDLQNEWEGCQAPLSGCLIRDKYPDRVVYQGLVTTAPAAMATDILNDNGKRWTLEEALMTLTRYWKFDDLLPCRQGVAYALVHFALLAHTLLGFYLQAGLWRKLGNLNMGHFLSKIGESQQEVIPCSPVFYTILRSYARSSPS